MSFTYDDAQINIQNIQSIVVSTIQPSGVDGDDQYLRMIQFFVDPPTMMTRRPALTVMCYGGSQSSGDMAELQVAVPASEF